jgi:hypothetical protein
MQLVDKQHVAVGQKSHYTGDCRKRSESPHPEQQQRLTRLLDECSVEHWKGVAENPDASLFYIGIDNGFDARRALYAHDGYLDSVFLLLLQRFSGRCQHMTRDNRCCRDRNGCRWSPGRDNGRRDRGGQCSPSEIPADENWINSENGYILSTSCESTVLGCGIGDCLGRARYRTCLNSARYCPDFPPDVTR